MRKRACFMVLLLGFVLLSVDYAVAFEKEQKQLLELFKRESSSERDSRRRMLSELHQGRIRITDEFKSELISIFLKESKFREEYIDEQKKLGLSESKAREKFFEEYEFSNKRYKDYYLDFAGMVSSLKDTRAIPGLLYGLAYYGGAIVPTHIISMGESAVEPLLEISNSDDNNLRRMALFVLSVWVNAPAVTEDYAITDEMAITNAALLHGIKEAMIKAVRDKNVGVRSSAVFALGAFPDVAVMRELEDIEKSDPYSIYNKYANKTEYPIREDAKKSIKKMKLKMQGKSMQK